MNIKYLLYNKTYIPIPVVRQKNNNNNDKNFKNLKWWFSFYFPSSLCLFLEGLYIRDTESPSG